MGEDVAKHEFTREDRTRYRVRTELRDRPTDDVMKAVDAWVKDTTYTGPRSSRRSSSSPKP